MYIITYIFIFLFGLIIGSFINCLVWRLHKKETLWGRSYCPHCRKHIAWYDNIPVISFFILRAKCRKCRKCRKCTTKPQWTQGEKKRDDRAGGQYPDVSECRPETTETGRVQKSTNEMFTLIRALVLCPPAQCGRG